MPTLAQQSLEQGRREAIAEGRLAYVTGVALADCPYRERFEADAWHEGWLMANKNDPLLDDDERENDLR